MSLIYILEKRNHQYQERNLRNSRLFKFPNTASSRYLNSPSLRLLKNFDTLDNDLTSSLTLSIFKANLKKKYFSIANTTPTTALGLPRQNEIFINRIRVGLLLNSSRYSHNFLDTPSPACRCGHHFQNVAHLFFNCTLIENQRQTLLESLTALNINDRFDNLNYNCKIKFLLYGDTNYTHETNKKIILATSQFIASSKFTFRHR